MEFLQINKLPEDMVGEIYSFIPLKSLSLTNKFYWKRYYKIKIKQESLTTSYWRFLLRYDYSFVFKEYLEYYFIYFIKNKRVIRDAIAKLKLETGLIYKYLPHLATKIKKGSGKKTRKKRRRKKKKKRRKTRRKRKKKKRKTRSRRR